MKMFLSFFVFFLAFANMNFAQDIYSSGYLIDENGN